MNFLKKRIFNYNILLASFLLILCTIPLITADSSSTYEFQQTFLGFVDNESDSNQIAISDKANYVAVSEYNTTSSDCDLFKLNSTELPYSNIPNYSYTVSDGIMAVGISEDGSTLAFGTSGTNATLFVIDAPSGDLLWKNYSATGERWNKIGVFSDGSKIIANSGEILYCFERDTGNLIWYYNATPLTNDWIYKSIAVSHDSRYIAVGLEEFLNPHGLVILFNATNGEIIWKHYDEGKAYGVAISDDGSTIAVSKTSTNETLVFNKESNISVLTYTFSGPVFQIAVDSSGERIAAGDDQGNLKVFSKASSSIILNKKISDYVGGLDISGDGKLLIAGSKDGTFYLYNIDTASLLLNLSISDKRINDAVFDYSGTSFAMVTLEGLVIVYKYQLITGNGTTTSEIPGFNLLFIIPMIVMIPVIAKLKKKY